jgi:hypothetical protein
MEESYGYLMFDDSRPCRAEGRAEREVLDVISPGDRGQHEAAPILRFLVDYREILRANSPPPTIRAPVPSPKSVAYSPEKPPVFGRALSAALG